MRCDCGKSTSRDVPVFPWYCICGAVWVSLTEKQGGPCKHLGESTGETIECSTCGGGGAIVQIMRCGIHGKCTLRKTKPRVGAPFDGPNCLTCKDRA